MGQNRNSILQLWDFMKENKKWWLLPTVILLILVGSLIFLSQASALSPFIYALV